MKHINRFETTEGFNNEKPQLNKLEHYLVYNTEDDKVYTKKDSYVKFMLEGSSSTSYEFYEILEDGSSKTLLIPGGESIVRGLVFGFKTNYDDVDTAAVEGCNGTIDCSNYDTSNITDMSNMFSGADRRIGVIISNFDTSNVTNMYRMFEQVKFKDNASMFDLSSFNTSKVTNMKQMFAGIQRLTSLDLSSFDTSKVTDMSDMFDGCSDLEELDLSNFSTSSVSDMTNMFGFCSSLVKIKCTKAFKEWCITNSSTIDLPETMVIGSVGAVGSGSNWELVDYTA